MATQKIQHDLSNTTLLEGSAPHLKPLTGDARQYDGLLGLLGLLGLIGPTRFALLGEASHGTHEFYRERAETTKQLITEKGFTAVTVEADWPDAWRVNRYVRGLSDDAALSGFQRFPAWMWRNTVVRDFVEWLSDYNTGLSPLRQVGFYGLDLYSLFSSIQAVLTYLDDVDPEAGRRARYRYGCFDHAAEDSQAYGYAASFGLKPNCEDEVVLVGFSTHRGWVTAASNWHELPQRKRVREGFPGSWEDVFHHAGTARFLLPAAPARRCSDTHRRNQRTGAAGCGAGVDRRRDAGDVSVRPLAIKEVR